LSLKRLLKSRRQPSDASADQKTRAEKSASAGSAAIRKAGTDVDSSHTSSDLVSELQTKIDQLERDNRRLRQQTEIVLAENQELKKPHASESAGRTSSALVSPQGWVTTIHGPSHSLGASASIERQTCGSPTETPTAHGEKATPQVGRRALQLTKVQRRRSMVIPLLPRASRTGIEALRELLIDLNEPVPPRPRVAKTKSSPSLRSKAQHDTGQAMDQASTATVVALPPLATLEQMAYGLLDELRNTAQGGEQTDTPPRDDHPD
jgi:hypothetical protein